MKPLEVISLKHINSQPKFKLQPQWFQPRRHQKMFLSSPSPRRRPPDQVGVGQNKRQTKSQPLIPKIYLPLPETLSEVHLISIGNQQKHALIQSYIVQKHSPPLIDHREIYLKDIQRWINTNITRLNKNLVILTYDHQNIHETTKIFSLNELFKKTKLTSTFTILHG